MKTGIELIAQERKEQIEKHGRNIESDVEINSCFQLSEAACYLAWLDIEEADCRDEAPCGWNLEQWQKMHDKPHEERLIIAGALIAAEIDRLNAIDDVLSNSK
ncbi:MAG: hypothetical protein AAF348_18780 [Bacteroidota bacterium]